MSWLNPVTLTGKFCTLIPLSIDHMDALIETIKDGELWKLWYTLIPSPDDMQADIEDRLKLLREDSMLPFVIVSNSSKKIIGATTLLNADLMNKRVEIGGTWIQSSLQKTGINTESKLLLLQHAFVDLKCHAVELRTHFCNQQSRKAIEGIGAKLDGVLRNHMIMPNGTLRDTCVYSILQSEWPTVEAHLLHKISA